MQVLTSGQADQLIGRTLARVRNVCGLHFFKVLLGKMVENVYGRVDLSILGTRRRHFQ